MPTVRAAIVGGGFMGRTHAQAIRASGNEVTAIISSNEASTKKAQEQIKPRKNHSNLSEILQDPEIDVIHICTPNSSHAEIAMRAFEANKHVICEKPLAVTVQESETLNKKAKQSSLVGAIPHVYRYHASVGALKKDYETAKAKLHTVQGHYLQEWLHDPSQSNWRVEAATGGKSRAFADIGTHLCDLFEYISSEKITNINAKKMIKYPSRQNKEVITEDAVIMMFETERGVIGAFTISQIAPGHKNDLQLRLICEKQSYEFSQENPNHYVLNTPKSKEIISRDISHNTHLNFLEYPAGHPMGYTDAFNRFVADTYYVIRGGNSEQLPDFEDGNRSLAILDAVMKSAETGNWVRV